MSTAPVVQPTPVIPVPPSQQEIRVYSHSSLFYWWPVWAVGFLMAILTLADGHVMAIVPNHTTVEAGRAVPGQEGEREILVLPKSGKVPRNAEGEIVQPHLHVANSKNLGVVFATVLLVIIVISNVQLRGLWSLAVVLLIILVVMAFALFNLWDQILEKFSLLDVRINAGGYLFISTVLFIIWALTVFVFDHRHYLIVTPGQIRLCLAVGQGETVYDTTGMTFQKQQNDLFRHWIVGLGAGDLLIHRSNTNQEIDMPNVLFIGNKIRQIEQLVKERPVV